jgi:hypothetical protein
MWNTTSRSNQDTAVLADLEMRTTPSIVPAIDELVGRFAVRGTVAAGEVVDVLLDLRLLAEADALLGSLV